MSHTVLSYMCQTGDLLSDVLCNNILYSKTRHESNFINTLRDNVFNFKLLSTNLFNAVRCGLLSYDNRRFCWNNQFDFTMRLNNRLLVSWSWSTMWKTLKFRTGIRDQDGSRSFSFLSVCIFYFFPYPCMFSYWNLITST